MLLGATTSCTSPTNNTLLHASTFQFSTNPLLQSSGIEVSLPAATSDCGANPVKVYVTKDNQYYIEDSLYTDLGEIERELLRQFDSLQSDKYIHLYADKQASWGYCVGIIDIARKNDIVLSVRSK